MLFRSPLAPRFDPPLVSSVALAICPGNLFLPLPPSPPLLMTPSVRLPSQPSDSDSLSRPGLPPLAPRFDSPLVSEKGPAALLHFAFFSSPPTTPAGPGGGRNEIPKPRSSARASRASDHRSARRSRQRRIGPRWHRLWGLLRSREAAAVWFDRERLRLRGRIERGCRVGAVGLDREGRLRPDESPRPALRREASFALPESATRTGQSRRPAVRAGALALRRAPL